VERMSESAAAPSIRFVAFHRPGPAWKADVDFLEQPGVDEHAAHYAEALSAGHLERGGPFLDASGGMMVFAPHVTRTLAEEVAASDPAVRGGLLLVDVKPWLPALSA
jgi:uncharacterized protein YciI